MKVEILQSGIEYRTVEIKSPDGEVLRVDLTPPLTTQIIEVNRSSRGESVYEVAVRNGFDGTESEFLTSIQGLSAYEVALNEGFVGTKMEWLESLKVHLTTSPEEAGKILTNNGSEYYWDDINTILNKTEINWDLGEI